jgi:uncharacterized membrane protein YccC
MIPILTAVKLVACLALGILVGGVLTYLYCAIVTVPDAETAARQAERAQWTLAIDAAQKKADADRITAQTKINALEQDFAQRATSNAAQMAALQLAIDQEKKNAPPSSACVSTPRSVSIALDSIRSHQ